MLQAAAAKAAKITVTSGKGTVSTNVADYAKKDLQVAFGNASVTTSVLLELIANRKTVLGAHHADHEKMGMTEGELQQAHAVLDAKRLMLVNRTVVRSLHDAVFPRLECLRDASHYQAQVHSQDARSYQDSPGREGDH